LQQAYDLAVLRQIAQTCGPDPDQAAAALSQGLYAEAVDRDWRQSRVLGVSAVPTFIAGGRGLAGAQPFAELERLVLAAGAAPRRD
jgi:predicted DsbA family dithiol-disulfide isomerase